MTDRFSFLFGDVQQEVFHQFSRLQAMTQWWHWLVLFSVCAVLLVFVSVTYWRDSIELGTAKRISLLLLRVLAFVGILFFFFDLEKRSQRQIIKNSRAAILVDTSLSMGIQDAPTAGTPRRIDAVIQELEQGDLLGQLRRDHDVVVYRFDQHSTPAQVASFLRLPSATTTDGDGNVTSTFMQQVVEARTIAAVAGAILVLSLISFVIYFLRRNKHTEDDTAWSFLVGMVMLLTAAVVLSLANLRHPDVEFLTIIGLEDANPPLLADDPPEDDSGDEAPAVVEWADALAPEGTETRLGDAIQTILQRERDGTLAGIMVVTDGGQNAGLEIDQVVRQAKSANVPLYPIGLGSAERPANVRVVDLEAPPRVFPGDSFSLNGYLQAFGLAGRTVTAQVLAHDPQEDPSSGELQDERRIRLGSDGEVIPIRFEVVPDVVGEQQYTLRIRTPDEDNDPRDDERGAKVQIVDRKNRVLLLAGGPTREFRFLRDLLFRDKDTTLDVLLQSGLPGMSQEADRLLFEFPDSADTLFEYDCVIAFDADWTKMSDNQVRLLERWISEEAGGLIVVAGPVHTPRWASRLRSDPRIDIIKSLYPVVFYSRGSATLSLGRFASETPWPLEFSRDGKDAEFLWLEDDALLSAEAWNSFSGVYGYYAVKDPKPGARVYSRFSDPSTAIDGDLPIYMAGHFYGAGRVFFQASGEMWRVRSLDDAFFERYYTKLIRWASQGRLLRDSSRGVLLVDKARCLLGDHVAVRAILTDAQFEPLMAEQVTATLTDPTGQRQLLEMRRVKDASRAGMFAAQFTATLEGDYRVELQPPHGDEGELLVREVRSRIPALETEKPERNDALLLFLAEQTDGEYFIGFDAAMNRQGAGRSPVYRQLTSQDQVSYVAGTPDKDFERILMTWLMGLICGALCLEWLVRRLSRLA